MDKKKEIFLIYSVLFLFSFISLNLISNNLLDSLVSSFLVILLVFFYELLSNFTKSLIFSNNKIIDLIFDKEFMFFELAVSLVFTVYILIHSVFLIFILEIFPKLGVPIWLAALMFFIRFLILRF